MTTYKITKRDSSVSTISADRMEQDGMGVRLFKTETTKLPDPEDGRKKIESTREVMVAMYGSSIVVSCEPTE